MNFIDGAIVGTGAALAASAASSILQTIFVRSRYIDSFDADVTLEERHEDTLTVTQHPVETGSNIQDHAYLNNAKLTVKCGWSNSTWHIGSLASNAGLSDVLDIFTGDYVHGIYEKFVKLQATRQPFDVQTGKRFYKNMIITRMSTTTDKDTEEALMLTVDMMSIIFADTQTFAVGSSSNMASPSTNGAPVDAGTKSARQLPAGASYGSATSVAAP